MASNSKISRESGPQRTELSHPPSRLVMVCGPREFTDPVILELGDAGFLTLRFTSNEKLLGYDDRAGVIVPDERFVANLKNHGQLQPGTAQRDGGDYFVTKGRNRLKAAALLNREASAKQFVEPYLFRFIVVQGTEEQAFVEGIIENEDRVKDPPTIRAAKMLRGKQVFGYTDEYMAELYRISPNQVRLTVDLLALSKEARDEVDAGRFPASLAARKIAQLPREDQCPTIFELRKHGIKGGSRAEHALDRLLDGKPLIDPEEAASADEPGDESPEDSASQVGANAGLAPTPAPTKRGHLAKEGAEDKTPRRAPNAPSKKRLATWVERSTNAAKAPDIEIPAKYQAAVDAALIRGARIAWQIQLGGTRVPGWAKIRDAVEHVEEEESEE